MATTTELSHVFPLGSRVNERGRLEVGGCDTIELAREFGTPAYVVVEDDLRARARAFLAAGARRPDDFHVVYASKAFAATPILSLFAQEGLWCDVASGGELALALAAGFAPDRIVLHGNAKSTAELRMALRHRIALIALDGTGDLDRLDLLIAEGMLADGPPQRVLVRVNPDVRGETNAKISTGQARSKFGFALEQAPAAIARVRRTPGLELAGLHAHVGSQLFSLHPFREAASVLASLDDDIPLYDLGGGLGVAYTDGQQPPSIESYVEAVLDAVHEHAGPHKSVMIEPGRALVANGCVTLYTVETVKRNVDTWVAVDGGMSDNLRPMLYEATYEAYVADRLQGDTRCVLVGKHCESGDVIVRDVLLADPRPGDVIVTPVTGAYGHALANNYNGVPRPPVLLCRDGDARVAVRRETFEDLRARDVL